MTTYRYQKIAFVAGPSSAAQEAVVRLQKQYGDCALQDAEIIVALGGDGVMLQTIHKMMGSKLPIYGMNCGSVGFLMNEYIEEDLLERLNKAELNIIHPLHMRAHTVDGAHHEALAINEVSLFRQTHQAAKISLSVDGKKRMDELICDGIMVATPAGSTAYNLSAHGPILPITAQLLALTPISPFRPRRWRGALLRNEAHVTLEVLEEEKRPVSAVADHAEFRDVTKVTIREESAIDIYMMFDPGHALDERILNEQFKY